jgi:putative transposase
MGRDFVAKAVQEWVAVVGAKTAYIEWGSPWENGYIESFNAGPEKTFPSRPDICL